MPVTIGVVSLNFKSSKHVCITAIITCTPLKLFPFFSFCIEPNMIYLFSYYQAQLFISNFFLSEAIIHMPRIGYQGGSQRSEWYTIERLLRKYSSLHGIDIFVYVMPLQFFFLSYLLMYLMLMNNRHRLPLTGTTFSVHPGNRQVLSSSCWRFCSKKPKLGVGKLGMFL